MTTAAKYTDTGTRIANTAAAIAALAEAFWKPVMATCVVRHMIIQESARHKLLPPTHSGHN